MLHDNMNISRLIVHSQQMEDIRVKSKTRDANRARSFDGGSSKGRLDIQDKPRFKKGFLIKFIPSSLRLVMIGCLTLSLKWEGVLVHQPRRQLVKSVARSIMVIFLREYIIVLVVVKVG